MGFIERLRGRIELESDESQERRYREYLGGLQKLYEVTWDLRGAFGARLFGRVVDYFYRQLERANFGEIGRERFFRVAGPIKIPLTPVKE